MLKRPEEDILYNHTAPPKLHMDHHFTKITCNTAPTQFLLGISKALLQDIDIQKASRHVIQLNDISPKAHITPQAGPCLTKSGLIKLSLSWHTLLKN